jgi:outer membrane protein OmpA-like peptidoglycan-associated protein
MQNHKILLLVMFAVALSCFNIAWANDLEDSKDHPKIPRVAGTVIIGYAESSYDEGVFISGTAGNKLVTENVEGKRTRIMYAGPQDVSPLGVLRNYQKAFGDLGELKEIYTCRGNKCFNNLGGVFTGRSSNQIRSLIGSDSQWFYRNSYYYKDQVYFYGTVTTADALYHVSVYASVQTEKSHSAVKEYRNHPLIHLEIVEAEDFEPTLEVVTAVDMTTSISEKGHIALYGINFDFDSDSLKPESDPTLEEISKALKSDTDLMIYVVGHTDNEGTLEYNEGLSKRRAASVVSELSSRYGIAIDRMSPFGAGPISPVATNNTEEGRALNRRVELVER